MHRSLSKVFLTGLVLAVFAAGCDGLLETEPSTELDPDAAQESMQGIDNIMTSVYNRLQSFSRYGNTLILGPEVLADNTQQHPVPSGRYSSEATNTHGSHMTFWNTAYLTISETNYVIEGLENIEVREGDVERRDRLYGEALFQRAYTYFDLARTYGYEPGREVGGWTQSAIIRTEPVRNVEDADLRSRSSNQEVYDLVVSDLNQALGLLEGNDRGVYFANYEATHALLARVHLYLEEWELAVQHANEAIALTNVSLVDAETFASTNIYEQTPNPESIMELSIDPEQESLGSNDAINAYISPAAWFDVLPSDELLALYDEDDVRNTLYTVHDDGHPYSLKYTESEGPYTDHIPLIRYPELLFILAEAHAELGNFEEAEEALNELRVARGIEPVSGYTNAEAFITQEVFPERRRELAFEGHRWYDLKRRAMDIPKPGNLATISYDDYRVLSILPSSEVDNNPELEQNPGY